MEKFKQLLERVPSLLKSVEERGYKSPTEIQEKVIPELLKADIDSNIKRNLDKSIDNIVIEFFLNSGNMLISLIQRVLEGLNNQRNLNYVLFIGIKFV